MSARFQRTHTLNTPAFASAPIFYPTWQNPSPVFGGQTSARIFQAIEAAPGQFTSYPPKHDDSCDEQLLYTYASFHEEPLAAPSINKCLCDDTWTLFIEVPIPKIHNPTLLALHYLIKYATAFDNGNSTIQTDTILTTKALPDRVVTKDTDLHVYHKDESETEIKGFSPRIVDHTEALALSTTLAIKSNGGGENWSHYIDNQHITPNVRIVDDSHLYVVFHVNEYPNVQTIRSLSVKVSATWQKEEVELKAIAEAERKAKEEAEKQAALEAERKRREAEERQARLEERQAREEERQARLEERQAREEDHKEREVRRANEVAYAPAVADEQQQNRIDAKLEELGLEKCSQGYGFKKTAWGYQCDGGGHKITFEQLGMK